MVKCLYNNELTFFQDDNGKSYIKETYDIMVPANSLVFDEGIIQYRDILNTRKAFTYALKSDTNAELILRQLMGIYEYYIFTLTKEDDILVGFISYESEGRKL